jgi:hypothetical protein
MNIAQSLNTEQKISFALSSVKIYRTLGDAKVIPVHIPKTTKVELQKKLKRDEFYANRVRLFLTTQVGRKAWCAACACLHPLRQFPSPLTSLSTSREQQLCFFVIDGGLKLLCRCPTLLSYDDVKAWIAAHKTRTFAIRSRHSNCLESITHPSRTTIQHPILHVETTGEVVLKAYIRIYRFPDHIFNTGVRNVMIGLNIIFCPHMESSDRKIIKKLLNQGSGVHSVYIGQQVKCGECDTEISLQKRQASIAGGLCGELLIERNLGRMKDDADPVWRRHCQRN